MVITALNIKLVFFPVQCKSGQVDDRPPGRCYGGGGRAP